MEPLIFKVIDEEKVLFKDKALFVIKTNNENKRFGLEVVNKTKSFGGVNSPSLATSTEVFEMLYKRLKNFNDYNAAIKYIKNIFALKRMYLMRFAIQAEDIKLSQNDIRKIARKNDCKFITKYNCVGDTKRPGWKTVQAVEQDDTLLGEFVGKSFLNEMRFMTDNKIDIGILNEMINFGQTK